MGNLLTPFYAFSYTLILHSSFHPSCFESREKLGMFLWALPSGQQIPRLRQAEILAVGIRMNICNCLLFISRKLFMLVRFLKFHHHICGSNTNTKLMPKIKSRNGTHPFLRHFICCLSSLYGRREGRAGIEGCKVLGVLRVALSIWAGWLSPLQLACITSSERCYFICLLIFIFFVQTRLTA